MTNQTLGRLKRVELRDIWASEAYDFTPWLAQEDNLEILSETLGLELELESTEKEVGPFRADVICKDLSSGTDALVLIENQLERTDHSHLGQLLTYMAGLHARVIIWIADRFTDEHRAALDLLNEITVSDFQFFGLEVELWKIGDSPAAPKFNIVSKPNDWSRAVAAGSTSSGPLTPTREIQRRYWEALRKVLLDRQSPVKPTKALPQNWMNISIGRSYFSLVPTINTQKNIIAVQLSMYGPDSKAHYHLLAEDKAAIEADMGVAMEWEELPHAKESRIVLRRDDMDPKEETTWQMQHQWMAENLEKLDQVFRSKVKALNAEDWVSPDVEAAE